MFNLKKLALTFLLILIASVPAMAAPSQGEIELSPTGEMPDFSGLVSLAERRAGVQSLAVRVNAPLPDGSTLRITVVKSGEELDLAVVTVELGTAYFKLVDSGQPTGFFPTGKLEAFFVYYKNIRVLEGKNPN